MAAPCLTPSREGIAMTDQWDARRGAPKGIAPKIITYTGAARPDDLQLDSATPPDPNGAVNASSIVELTNDFFTIYDKASGGEAAPRMDAKTFWLYAGIPDFRGGVVDPRLLFLPDARPQGRWLAVQLDLGNRVLIATSNPDNPTIDPRYRQWKGAAFDFAGNDFTMLGYDARWVYIGTNVESGQSRMPKIAVIPRAKALAWPPLVGPNDVKFIGPLDPKDYGIYPYPVIAPQGDGTVGLMIGIDTVTRSHLAWSLIANGTIADHGKIAVPSFYTVPAGYMLKQPYDRDGTESRVYFNNDGVVAAPTADASNVWLAHTISSTPNPRGDNQQLGVRWYRLAIDPVSRQPSLAKCGDIGYRCYDHFNPSILSFGKDDYTPNVKQRWGDYSTICRDPTNPRTAWMFNQYVTQGGPSTSRNCDVMARMDLPPP
jgi:hypothetical protein